MNKDEGLVSDEKEHLNQPNQEDDLVIRFSSPNQEEYLTDRSDLNKFALVMSFAVIAQKWLAGSQIFPILSAKFGWDTEAEEEKGL